MFIQQSPLLVVPAEQLLLDLIGTPARGAFSTRKIKSSYTGYCMRVRESGGASADIGFSGNLLDTATLLAHCGNNDGFIATWYDQSGNGQDVTNSVGNQPKIVSAGTPATLITTINGKPSIEFDGTNQNLVGAAISNFISASARTVLHSARPAAGGGGGSGGRVLVGDGASGYFWNSFTTAGTLVNFGHYHGGDFNASLSIGAFNTDHTLVGKHSGGTISGYVDGGTPATQAAGDVDSLTGVLTIGRGSLAYYQGAVLELLLFDSALSSSEINLLGNEMESYNGVTWTDVS